MRIWIACCWYMGHACLLRTQVILCQSGSDHQGYEHCHQHGCEHHYGHIGRVDNSMNIITMNNQRMHTNCSFSARQIITFCTKTCHINLNTHRNFLPSSTPPPNPYLPYIISPLIQDYQYPLQADHAPLGQDAWVSDTRHLHTLQLIVHMYVLALSTSFRGI